MNFPKSLMNIYKSTWRQGKLSAKRLIKKPVFVMTNKLPKNWRDKVRQTKVYFKLFKPMRPQRVYLKNNLSHMHFLEQLNERKVEYVLLRWWENLPDYPEREDLNLLIKDEQRDLINDLVTIYDEEGMKCDLYTVNGGKNGSRINVPVFSQNLSRDLFETSYLYNGGYVPSPVPYFASVAYHALFHKGYNSGIPGFGMEPTKYVYDYSTFLKDFAREHGIEVEITVKGLFHWLKERGYAPAADTLTKLADIRPEISILEPPLSSDVRGGEILVFVVRQRLLDEVLLDDFQKYLEEEYNFDVLDVKIFSESEKETCTNQIRGGKWDKGPWKETGGPPVALVIAFDYHPVPLTETEQAIHTRTTNYRTVQAKYGYRDRLNKINKKRDNYNGLHSGDNELDAWFYISLLGDAYTQEIKRKAELRRERYSVKYSVVELLGIGPISKVELIKYNKGLAVKKTFRPGRERFLERELYCTNELSKELSFIPSTLEVGDGYLIMPYLENILTNLDSKEKKKKIFEKKQQLIKVIDEMYNRNLAFVNFNPDSLIITPEDHLFCTGYSYVQQYQDQPESLKDLFKNSGLPKKSHIKDIPQNFKNSSHSFKEVWKPYISVRDLHKYMILNKIENAVQ